MIDDEAVLFRPLRILEIATSNPTSRWTAPSCENQPASEPPVGQPVFFGRVQPRRFFGYVTQMTPKVDVGVQHAGSQ
jgi:hypothetical protein